MPYKDPDKNRAYQREWIKKHRKDNPEIHRERKKAWRKKYPEKYKAEKNRYLSRHPRDYKVYMAKRRYGEFYELVSLLKDLKLQIRNLG